MSAAFRRCGLRETVIFADKLMHRLHVRDAWPSISLAKC
jgi:hypothetical protein